MAKRSNPFVEDYIPQSKMYIGLKQFNNNEDRLRKVYEKTLDLLFNGAKKTFPPEGTNESNTIYTNRKENMKQLFISKDGSLLHSGKLVETQLENKSCNCGHAVEQKCAYCERWLCSMCQHSCTHCDQTYCKQCMLLGSDVCVSCYS